MISKCKVYKFDVTDGYKKSTLLTLFKESICF